MPRLTIEEFRARLVDRTTATPLLRAYRDLGRRPDVALSLRGPGLGWAEWPEPGLRAAGA